MKRNIEYLKKLVETASPSGDEIEAGRVFSEECLLGEGVNFEGVDRNGNVAVSKGSGDFQIMISGHLDNISLTVQTITEHGFLHVVPNGGVDRKVLQGQLVDVVTQDKGIVTGIIGKSPIHVEDREQRETVNKWESFLVDVGASSKEEVQELGIDIGDNIVYHSGSSILEFGPQKNKIMSKDLDDKIGIYIITEVIKRVNVPSGIKLWALGMTSEEVGLVGAKIASKQINPDLSIDIDVTPATESELGISKDKYGDVEINKGPVLSFGYCKSRRIGRALRDICVKNEIPHQFEVSTAGGTNTAAIQEHSLNCETFLISLPNQNMHTSVEVCGWVDVEACIDLLIKYIESYKV